MAPRIPSNSRQAPKGAAAPRATIGDNSAAVEEADRVQMISLISKLSTAEDEIELAKVPLKAAQDARKKIIGLGKAAGFTAAELKARLEEMKVPTRDMAEKAAREHKHRRWLGILDADQSKLLLGDEAPQETKDEAHWSGEGLKAGLRQMSSTPPSECPERFVQAFMKAHEVGLKQVLQANAPGQLRAKAAAEFAEDNPEIDVAKEARKLKASGFMEPTGDDGFETSEEELAAQAPRQAIKGAEAGATSGETAEEVL